MIQDGVDAGGSYVFVQRWEHNLKQLNRMSVPDQEMMIGRTKEANEEIDGDARPETSHLSRVDLKEEGKGLKIVRQSLPYGTASGTHGLYFCAYCARLHNIEQQLLSMFGDTDGKRDAMLRFTKPVTGGYYFAPSWIGCWRCKSSSSPSPRREREPFGAVGKRRPFSGSGCVIQISFAILLFSFRLPNRQTVYKTVTPFIAVINMMISRKSSY